MKIYTKTGDEGQTGLLGGRRVWKDDPRIAATGTVDELNAALGLIQTAQPPPSIVAHLTAIQHDLFALGAQLSIPTGAAKPSPPAVAISAADLQQLETWIDGFDAELPPLRNFILPGGEPAACHLHIARGVCRRAERQVVALSRADAGGEYSLPLRYLNRLSDLLFVLARSVNHLAGTPDVIWTTSSTSDEA